jgi:hypothetical protein
LGKTLFPSAAAPTAPGLRSPAFEREKFLGNGQQCKASAPVEEKGRIALSLETLTPSIPIQC